VKRLGTSKPLFSHGTKEENWKRGTNSSARGTWKVLFFRSTFFRKRRYHLPFSSASS